MKAACDAGPLLASEAAAGRFSRVCSKPLLGNAATSALIKAVTLPHMVATNGAYQLAGWNLTRARRSEMTNNSTTPAPSIPADDLNRSLTVADPDGAGVTHVSVAGGTYTILVTGAQTAGHYCLVEMLVPAGGGPPPHRHDFEEMFTLLEGELEFTFRGKSQIVRAGSTVNVPANAPHAFRNVSGATARMLCMCTPAGQEELFMAVGFPVDSRTSPPPKPTEQELAEKGKLLAALLPKYRTEMVKP
jgi:quercetin dioxygenase-like cupin family protein